LISCKFINPDTNKICGIITDTGYVFCKKHNRQVKAFREEQKREYPEVIFKEMDAAFLTAYKDRSILVSTIASHLAHPGTDNFIERYRAYERRAINLLNSLAAQRQEEIIFTPSSAISFPDAVKLVIEISNKVSLANILALFEPFNLNHAGLMTIIIQGRFGGLLANDIGENCLQWQYLGELRVSIIRTQERFQKKSLSTAR
jgi:hypothetical protein